MIVSLETERKKVKCLDLHSLLAAITSSGHLSGWRWLVEDHQEYLLAQKIDEENLWHEFIMICGVQCQKLSVWMFWNCMESKCVLFMFCAELSEVMSLTTIVSCLICQYLGSSRKSRIVTLSSRWPGSISNIGRCRIGRALQPYMTCHGCID